MKYLLFCAFFTLTVGMLQQVVFHVIHTDIGKISSVILNNQIKVLNKAFFNVKFVLSEINYINDKNLHSCENYNTQIKIKKTFAKDPSVYLNIYICDVSSSLGLSWLPTTPFLGKIVPESHFIFGIMLDYKVLPGSRRKYFNKGLILVHEIGHHYGLKHLYSGGCLGNESISDGILDTPRQFGNTFNTNCKKIYDTCPNKPGIDDNSNYMSIFPDRCRNHFTKGQIEFMKNTIKKYKPKMLQN